MKYNDFSTEKFTEDGQKHFSVNMMESKFEIENVENRKKDKQKTKTKQQKKLL